MTKLTFSTNEAVSLEKSVDLTSNAFQTDPEDLDETYEILRCSQWIQMNKFQTVCLQFPDYLLPDSTEVLLRLQEILNQTLYLLGDTAYESCCIDYIAAAHINADAIIHFGPICFSKTSASIPFLHVYEKHPLNLIEFKKCLAEQQKNGKEEFITVVDSIYLYLYDKLQSICKDLNNVTLQRIDKIDDFPKNKQIFFLGNNHQKLLNIALNFKPKILYYYVDMELKVFNHSSKIIKRRNFIIEKIKDSETIGIVIGTLGVKNYLKILDRIKSLISESGKKYYLISVGKPTVAKLANFPELDIYVVVTCSMSEIYESRDFYKPIATPFDVEAALNLDPEKNSDFTYDYNAFLNDSEIIASSDPTGDVSLLTNRLRLPNSKDENIINDLSLALKNDGTVALGNSGAGYLAQRSWQGLEQHLGQTTVEVAKEGRSGIPLHYKNEENQ